MSEHSSSKKGLNLGTAVFWVVVIFGACFALFQLNELFGDRPVSTPAVTSQGLTAAEVRALIAEENAEETPQTPPQTEASPTASSAPPPAPPPSRPAMDLMDSASPGAHGFTQVREYWWYRRDATDCKTVYPRGSSQADIDAFYAQWCGEYSQEVRHNQIY